MARQTEVITPENIPLTLELAGIGTRFGALLVDMLIQTIATVIGLIVFGIAAGFSEAVGGGGPVWIALMIAAIFLIWFGYFILFEAIWNGQTPGKRLFGLRVVRDGGYPVNFFAVATRNLIRIADFLPVSYAAGAITVFLNPEYKRLGDLVAGTLVIKERTVNPLLAFQSIAPSGTVAPVASRLPESVVNPYDALTHEELLLLRRYALRRWEMTSDDSERLAYRLIVPLVPRLNLTFLPGVPPRYADLASVLVQAADARESELTAQAR